MSAASTVVGLPGGLYPYQQTFLDRIVEMPRCVLAFDTGLGKTRTAIAALSHPATQAGGGGPSDLILCPAHLTGQWVGELGRLAPGVTVVSSDEQWIKSPNPGNQRRFNAAFPGGPDVYVMGHDFHARRQDVYGDVRWRYLIVDEAAEQRGGGKVHAAIVGASRNAERALLLTASLHENSAIDLLHLLEMTDPDGLPWTRDEFYGRYVEWVPSDYGARYGGYTPAGLRNAGELREHLRRWVMLLSTEDAGIPMPRLVEREIVAPLTARQRAEYRRPIYDTPSGFNKRSLIASHFQGESGCANAALEYITEHPEHRKLLIRAEHRDHLDVVGNLLDTRGIRWVRIDGGKSHGERADAVQMFRDDPGVRVLLGTKVLERGVDGCQVADLMISLVSSYNPARERQAAGRICRIGSPHTTVTHLTITPDASVAQRRGRIVGRKRADGELLFGDWVNADEAAQRSA